MALFGFLKKKEQAPPGFDNNAVQGGALAAAPAGQSSEPLSDFSQQLKEMQQEHEAALADTVPTPAGGQTPPLAQQSVPSTSSPVAAPQVSSLPDPVPVQPVGEPASVPAPAAPSLDVESSFQVPDFSEEELKQSQQLPPAPEPTTAPAAPPGAASLQVSSLPDPVLAQDIPAVSPVPQPEVLQQPAQEMSPVDSIPSSQPVPEQQQSPSQDVSFAIEDVISDEAERSVPEQMLVPDPVPVEESEPATDDEGIAPVEERVVVRHQTGTDIFVEKVAYQDALLMAAEIEQDIHKASDHFTRVIDDEAIVTAKLSDWHDVMNLIQEKLMFVDARMFEKGENNG